MTRNAADAPSGAPARAAWPQPHQERLCELPRRPLVEVLIDNELGRLCAEFVRNNLGDTTRNVSAAK